MSIKKSTVRQAVRFSLIAAATASVAYTAPAFAQQAPSLDTVVVTGSRIAKRDAIAESPILTVDSAAIETSGFVAVEQFLNTLPQVTPGISSQSNNPSSNGRAFLDLRGLGSNRNLVLIDGRRGMGSTGGGVVDINTIPAALIDRTEIITGGAAAVYGADAIAGVVNFILKKNFEGVQIDGGYNITEEGDGMQWNTDITLGGTFADGRGSAVFNVGYYKRDDLYKGARKFSAQASSATGTFPGGGWTTGVNTPSQAAVDAAFGPGACALNGGGAGFQFNPDGSLFCTGVSGSPLDVVGYTGPDSWIATQFYPDIFSYNFEPDNILVLPMERWSFFTRSEYEMSDNFKPYVQAMFTNYNALQELAATPASGTTGWNVPVTNPFITTQMADLLATRANPTAPFAFSKRFNDLGGRTGDNTHDVWQAVVGATGDIAGSWTYDAFASYGRSVQNEVQGGNVRRDRVQTLLDAADGGASLCDGGLNLFGAAPQTNISADCAAYISLEAKNLTTVIQRNIEAVATGDLFELPAGPVQAAIGASWRDISLKFQPDGGLQPGLVAGFNQQLPVSGKLNYGDLFAEVSVPILHDLPLIQSLSVTGGFRNTDNNLFGNESSWKLSLDWKLIDSLRFRGGFQKAVRSPNINELFAPQLNNFPTFTNSDPCNTTGAIAAQYRNGPNGAQVQALCAAQSAVAGAAGYFQPAGQANGITGGNPNLTPETSDSWTAGFVFSSHADSPMFERFTFSLDYFSIELEEVIAAVGAVTIVQRCFNRDNANPGYDMNNSWCQLFNRDQGNGGVIELQQLSQNQAFLTVTGVDFAADWRFPLGERGGDLGFSLIGTWTDTSESQTTSVDPVYDFAGSIGQVTASAVPEWRGTFTTSWSYRDLGVQATARYIDEMIHANVVTGSSPLANTGVDATWYLDLAGTYNLNDNLSFRLGVSNVTNQEPRLYTPNVQANTDPSTYDVLGRRYFAGVKMRF